MFRSLKASASPSLDSHLLATYRWLCEAQDAGADDGVAARYDLRRGWSASYPETTGYIMPSFLTYGDVTADPDAIARARRMAVWEITIQLPNGAVRGGDMDAGSEPAVFNTGQVLFGWNAVHARFPERRFADAIERAAVWLIGVQDADGAWRRHLSALTSTAVQTYNTRTAWALAQSGLLLGRQDWVDAARRNCDWALTQQEPSGWFANNTFNGETASLLHTIAYAIEGLFGTGILLGEPRFIESARRAVDGLLANLAGSGRLFGYYGSNWESNARFRCLTGDAQLAGILLRFFRFGGVPASYETTAIGIIKELCRLQVMSPKHREVCGAIAGSDPIWGDYKRYCFPNWAAKFHMDSLLLHLHHVDPHDLGTTIGGQSRNA